VVVVVQGSEIERILNDCTECKACLTGCPFLTQLDLTPKDVVSWFVEGKDVVEAAYSCALCGSCEFTCLNGLNPSKAFLELREALVDSKRGPLTAHRLIYTNRKWNTYTLFQDKYANEFTMALNHAYMRALESRFDYVFLPGCALSTFAPEVTKKTHDLLNSKLGNVGLFSRCCGRPLEELGLVEEFGENTSLLRSDLDKMGSPDIITSCPLCFHTLKRNLVGYQIYSAYELLKEYPFGLRVSGAIAIHDSCPFRYYPDQLDTVREIFNLNNVDLIELEFSKVNTVCCGAGGGIALASPDISKGFSELVTNNAKERGVTILATYCETCALTLTPTASKHGIRLIHILDLITGHEPNYPDVLQKVQSLFTEPELVRSLERLGLSEW